MKKTSFKSYFRFLPNLLTMTNVFMGLFAILQVIGSPDEKGRKVACLCILIGALADALDGKVARGLGVVSPMGKQLDSLADLISFGVAPMAILYSFEVMQANPVLFACIALYPLAGAYRLARFNLGNFTDYFLGLPITAAGVSMVLYNLLINKFIGGFGQELPQFTALVLVGLALLMASSVPVPRISTLIRSSREWI